MKKNLFLILAAFLTGTTACTTEDPIAQSESTDNLVSTAYGPTATTSEGTDVYAVPGDRIPNPYSIENMKRAMAEAVPAATRAAIDLEPTHYYVRFKYADRTEREYLQSLGVEYLDWPLDMQFEGEGLVPAEITLSDEYKGMYTYWPADRKLPDGIEYEILDKLCVPADAGFALSESEMEQLESIAFAQVHADKVSSLKLGIAGTFKAWDDIIGDYVPVERLKVKLSTFNTIAYTFTDADGRFFLELPGQSGLRTMSYAWEDTNWEIGNRTADGETISAAGVFTATEQNFSSGKTQRYAAILRTLNFRCENSLGLSNVGDTKVYLDYYHGTAPLSTRAVILPEYSKSAIIYGADQLEGWYTTPKIMNQSFMAMETLIRSDIRAKDLVLQSSWKAFVAWLQNDKEYSDRGHNGILHTYHTMMNGSFLTRFETPDNFNLQGVIKTNVPSFIKKGRPLPLFIDLYDNNNQQVYAFNDGVTNSNLYLFDEVCIQDIAKLQRLFNRSDTIEEVINSLGTYGVSEEDINYYSDFYLQ